MQTENSSTLVRPGATMGINLHALRSGHWGSGTPGSDHGRRNQSNPQSPLSDGLLAEVITEIRQLWPDCGMVRGSARHSELNGGVERVNRTVQDIQHLVMSDASNIFFSTLVQIPIPRPRAMKMTKCSIVTNPDPKTSACQSGNHYLGRLKCRSVQTQDAFL